MTPTRLRHVRARAWWIAGGYAVIGVLWIFFSDRALEAIAEPEQLARFGTVKGVGYVVVTAVALWWLMHRSLGQVADAYEGLEEREVELERVTRLYAALTEINQAIVRRTDRAALLTDACRALVQHGGFHTAWVGWHDTDAQRIVPVAGWGGAAEYIDRVSIRTEDVPEGRGPSGAVVRAGRPYISNDIGTDPTLDPWRTEMERHGLRSVASFPVRDSDSVFGVLNVYADELDYFQSGEIDLLTEAAADVSYALEVLEIDELRATAEAAAEQERRFSEEMIDAMPGVVYFYDESGALLRWNRNFETVTGYHHDEIAVMHPLDFFAESWKQSVGNGIAEVFRDGISAVEAPFLNRDGTTTPYYFTGRRVEYDGRDCLVGVGIDISVRVRAETDLHELNETLERQVTTRTEELRTALERAEVADEMKSAFLATMSHELRTPLNSIIGFTGIVLQELAGPLNAEQAKQLGMVRTSARHLLALINDVLDISKIEAGQLEVRSDPFDISTSVERVLASVTPMAEAKGLELVLDVADDLGTMISDQRRLEQILLNLLSNAVKFTERGSIRLRIERGDRIVGICVTDTGIGIAPHDLRELFQPFRQVDTGLTRTHDGTGLGLAICRRLAILMGGTVEATSAPGRGSEFRVELPLGVLAETEATAPPGTTA